MLLCPRCGKKIENTAGVCYSCVDGIGKSPVHINATPGIVTQYVDDAAALITMLERQLEERTRERDENKEWFNEQWEAFQLINSALAKNHELLTPHDGGAKEAAMNIVASIEAIRDRAESAERLLAERTRESDSWRRVAERLEGEKLSAERALAEARKDAELYRELIYAVASKWPGETRHETALRYIMERETSRGGMGDGRAAINSAIEAEKQNDKQ